MPSVHGSAIGAWFDRLTMSGGIAVSGGIGAPTRGLRLWITVAEMRRPGRKLQIHLGAGLLTMYGIAEPEITETAIRPGTMVRANIPF